jgi:hypothetical protein
MNNSIKHASYYVGNTVQVGIKKLLENYLTRGRKLNWKSTSPAAGEAQTRVVRMEFK